MKTKLFVFLTLSILLSSCQSDVDINKYQQKGDNMEEKHFTVDPNLVIGIAKNIDLYTSVATKSTLVEKEIESFIPYGKGRSVPAFYIVNYKGNGFSIISADKRVNPILGYSEDGSFSMEDIPDGLNLWLEWVSERISYYRAENIQADPMTTSVWNSTECPVKPIRNICDNVDNISTITKGPYLSSTWDQRNGYNAFCPEGCPAGCVPVAAAQIMRFWKHPNKYHWDNMPLDKASTATARLLSELGSEFYFDVSYSPTGTSARNAFTDNVLRDLGYSSATRNKYNYATLKGELYAGRPVLLEGKNSVSGGGHTWVCDGIWITNYTTNSTSMLHMNWGWNGKYNAYYNIGDWSYKNPTTGELIFDYSPGFLYRMIVNIHP